MESVVPPTEPAHWLADLSVVELRRLFHRMRARSTLAQKQVTSTGSRSRGNALMHKLPAPAGQMHAHASSLVE